MPSLQRPDLGDPISHYVEGNSRLLLMEPLVTTRESFEKELRDVYRTFMEWRGVEHYARFPQETTLIAYVQGAIEERVVEARRALTPIDRLFNVDDPGDRRQFISLIREVGSSGSPGPLLS